MAALVGFFGARSSARLERMAAELSHRGPTVAARHEQEGVSILLRDRAAGSRSLLHATAERVVAAAGVLRRVDDGTRLDAAQLHELVGRHGVEVLHQLRGRFVLAVWTPAGGWLARDGAGVRALYVAHFQGAVCFASEPKALHRLPGFPRRLRQSAVAQYLSFSFVPGPHTMLEDVYELPGGHWLPADPTREPAPRRWFRFEEAEAEDASEETVPWPARLRTALHQATAEMLDEGQPAAFLSGGLDSSVVVAELAELRGPGFPTYSLHFGDAYRHELEYARMVAERFQTDHQEVLISPKGFLPRLWSAVWHMDDPIGDPITVPNFELARHAAAQGIDRVFNGEGGDPCFGGPKNITMMMHHWYGGLERPPHFLETAYLRSYRRAYTELDHLLTPELRAAAPPAQLEGLLTPFFTASQPRSFLHKLLSINIRLKGGNLILPKVERMLGAHGVDSMSPLFEDHLVRLAFAMPPRCKLEEGVEKRVIKDAYRGRVPDPVVDRPKSGMRVPVHYWFQNELRRYARKVLSPRSLRRAGIFRPERVKQLLNYEIEEGPGRYGMRLWMLLTFEIWRRQVIEGERP